MITRMEPDEHGQVHTAFGAICSYCSRVIERDPAIVTPAGNTFHPHCAVAMAAYYRHLSDRIWSEATSALWSRDAAELWLTPSTPPAVAPAPSENHFDEGDAI